jgi:hypothetical protein
MAVPCLDSKELVFQVIKPSSGTTLSPGALSSKVKRPEREADYLSPPSVEVKNG